MELGNRSRPITTLTRALAEFPFLSVAVSVTTCAPRDMARIFRCCPCPINPSRSEFHVKLVPGSPNPSSPPNENGIPLHLGFENSRLFAAGLSAPGPSLRLSRLGSSLSPAPPEPTRRVLSPRPILQSRIGVNA